jgi:hypothetical protein
MQVQRPDLVVPFPGNKVSKCFFFAAEIKFAACLRAAQNTDTDQLEMKPVFSGDGGAKCFPQIWGKLRKERLRQQCPSYSPLHSISIVEAITRHEFY